jgi:hypothetical protein
MLMRDHLNYASGPAAIAIAQRRVCIPAIGLIVTGILTLVVAIVGAYGITTIPEIIQTRCDEIEKEPRLTEIKKRDLIDSVKRMELTVTVVAIITDLFYASMAVIVIVGGIKLKNLTSAGWARSAAILGMIPLCVSYAWLLGLPFGIWTIRVLRRPDVQAGMAARLLGETGDDD